MHMTLVLSDLKRPDDNCSKVIMGLVLLGTSLGAFLVMRLFTVPDKSGWVVIDSRLAAAAVLSRLSLSIRDRRWHIAPECWVVLLSMAVL